MRRISRPLRGLLFLLALIHAPPVQADEIRIESVLVTVIDEVKIPAAVEGPLAEVSVRQGSILEADQLIARVRDNTVVLELEQARINLRNAQRESRNTVKIRLAKKNHELANAELQRVLRSRTRLKDSISKAEADRKQLAVDKALLEIEQAEHELATALLAVSAFENEVMLAEERKRQRQITAPIAGVVVEVSRKRGEWVKPGDQVFRVLRLDRLRVEGFLPPSTLPQMIGGRPVMLELSLPNKGIVRFPGRVTFVSPELNPVNSQFRVLAEIDNRDLQLRPGLKGSLIIQDKPPTKADDKKGGAENADAKKPDAEKSDSQKSEINKPDAKRAGDQPNGGDRVEKR